METKGSSYAPLTLANTFIKLYGGDVGIDHMKLQKLAYYSYGWWLAFNNCPLLSERPQVWRYGPVFKSLYNALKSFKEQGITEPQKLLPFEDKPQLIDNEEVLKLVSWIWTKYGSYSAIELSELTHAEGTPWKEIAVKYNFYVPENFEIPDECMRSFFTKEAAELQPHVG